MGTHNQNGRGQHDDGHQSYRPQDQSDEYGQGQSGYAAGRQADDRSLQFRNRNQSQQRWGHDEDQERGFGNTDERFTGGRGGEDYNMDRDRRGYDPERFGVPGGYGGGHHMEPERIGPRGDMSREQNTGYDHDRSGNQGGFRSGSMGGQGYHNAQAREYNARDRGPYDDSGRGARSWNPQDSYREIGGRSASQQQGQHKGKGPQGYQRSDDRIRENVCEALSDDEHLDATHIEVTVKNGEVTLAGMVEDRRAKRMAEDIAERSAGVKDVQNQIKIGGNNDSQNGGNPGGNGSVDKSKARA